MHRPPLQDRTAEVACDKNKLLEHIVLRSCLPGTDPISGGKIGKIHVLVRCRPHFGPEARHGVCTRQTGSQILWPKSSACLGRRGFMVSLGEGFGFGFRWVGGEGAAFLWK